VRFIRAIQLMSTGASLVWPRSNGRESWEIERIVAQLAGRGFDPYVILK
jgi:hypothetical protein